MNLQQTGRIASLVLLFCGLARAETITSFDAPGASQGTFALAVNVEGAIAGYYVDSNFENHGFVRTPDGAISTFDAPNAGQGAFIGTTAVAINASGRVTGYYYDANDIAHGFLRDRNGSFFAFDAPGAGAGAGSFAGTLPAAINQDGTITGAFLDSNLVYHGFLRSRDGAVTAFDDPNAGATVPFAGTNPVALNDRGAIVGCYGDSNNGGHNFERRSRSVFATLDPPGAPVFQNFGATCPSGEFSMVQGMAISPLGTVTGSYFEPLQGNIFGGNVRGWVLRPDDDSYITFDAVASPSSPCCTWTYPISINLEGAIAGFVNDFTGTNRGFVRAPNGDVAVFDAPGASTGPGRGTVPSSINLFGVIAGYYVDANHVGHGFVRTHDE
jgi:hypothetical protein